MTLSMQILYSASTMRYRKHDGSNPSSSLQTHNHSPTRTCLGPPPPQGGLALDNIRWGTDDPRNRKSNYHNSDGLGVRGGCRCWLEVSSTCRGASERWISSIGQLKISRAMLEPRNMEYPSLSLNDHLRGLSYVLRWIFRVPLRVAGFR